jgi:uncharacterized protein involved in outer membrane biogenesis
MPKLRTIFIWVVALFIFFTIAGFFAVPPLLKHLLIKNLSTELNRDVSISKIKVNPYDLTITVSGFAVKEKGTAEVFLSFEELFANVQVISIFKRAIVVSEIRLTKPFARIIREEDGSYNFNDLIEKFTRETVPPEKKSQPIHFSINNISIINGSADFLDAPKEVFHEITDVNLAVPFVSNIRYHVEKTYVQPRFSALVNGDSFAIEGKTKPFADSLETEFDINIHDLDLADYLGYVPAHKKFKLLSGALDLTGKLSYVLHEDKGPDLVLTGKMTLRDIDLADESSKSLWKVNKTEFEIAFLKPFEASVHLSRVDIQSPEINMRRNKDGTIDIFTLMGLLAGAKEQQGEAKTPAEIKDKKPMSLLVDTWQTKDGRVRFQDFMPHEPVTVELKNAELEAKNVSLTKGSKADIQFSFLLGKTGKVSGKGVVGLEPLAANLSLDVKGLGINAFQPYFTDKVRVYISSGNVNTSGALVLARPEGKDMTARYTGKLLVTEFNATDKEALDELLRWKTLSLEGLDVNYNPLQFAVKGVSLSDFFAAITINSDGTLNLHQLMVAEQESTRPDEKTLIRTTEGKGAADTEPALPKNVEIGGITLQGGTIKFTDKSIKPAYTANLTQIGGRVSSLSMKKDMVADVEVRGKLNDYVPLEITGKVNPWKEHFFVDLTASTKNFELGPLSPYSGKYVGYTIDKGQLSFDLKYLIIQKKLESQNRILLDQFTFGDKVESPDATKLPVRLAVALLKDRKGQIKLDLPVSGNIDDPKFSIWKIIWQILGNLLAKAATSPFTLLGALFGGGEELSYVEFDYGRANLVEPNLKKIDTVVKALDDRPALKLDIQGYVDVERDTEGLKNYLFQRKVKTQKLKELTKKGSETVPVDDIKVEPTEYEKYLRIAYDAEKFPKPRNIVGLAKTLPVPEMEKLILTNTIVKNEDLGMLANQRASNVKDAILKSGKISSDRVFLVETKTLTPEKKENIKNSRVDFKLK